MVIYPVDLLFQGGAVGLDLLDVVLVIVVLVCARFTALVLGGISVADDKKQQR
jgi:hypothetical protein